MTTDCAEGSEHHGSFDRRAPKRRRWLAAVGVTMATASVAAMPTSSALARTGSMGNPAKVIVKVVAVSGFGSILETKKHLPLYTDGSPPCTGGCLTIWPPLLMPGKKTIPLGVSGLGTMPFGTGLQVTYNGQPLYTFIYDMKRKPPTGNGVQNFVLATVG